MNSLKNVKLQNVKDDNRNKRGNNLVKYQSPDSRYTPAASGERKYPLTINIKSQFHLIRVQDKKVQLAIDNNKKSTKS